jgi:tRNA G37 N-methylase Trm5
MRYTCIGDIAVVYIPEEREHEEHEIAETICRKDPRVAVVVRRLGRYGEFRRQKVKVLLGDRTETVHTEYGIRIRVDVENTYFSEREKTESQRLQSLVSKRENPGFVCRRGQNTLDSGENQECGYNCSEEK